MKKFDNQMLTVREAAQKLNLSYFTVLNHIKAGKIKAVRIVGRLLIPIEEFERITQGGVA